jgi:hypothetical protein
VLKGPPVKLTHGFADTKATPTSVATAPHLSPFHQSGCAAPMSGIDPQTKKFTEPPNQIKNEIAALKADKSVPEAEKKQGLAQLEAALKNAKPIQFKENITLVLKYFDQLAPLMREQDSDLRPADWRHISSSATSKAKLDAAQTSNAPTPLLRQQARTSRAVASAFRRRSPACHSARARPASA